jgi:ABC-type branched-subunit amino acid transport system permease subunit
MRATLPRTGLPNLPGLRRANLRELNTIVYVLLAIGALIAPMIISFAIPNEFGSTVGQLADAGVWVLLAIGLNIVVGFAGLLDLGYAAFFAIGAYTYAMLASGQLGSSPIHHAIHLPFWLLLFVAVVAAATFGVILGAPTLRLRGDYLAIVTLGFGEIVPRVFRNLKDWTGGVNAISAIDQPTLPAWLQGPWAGGLNLGVVSPFAFSFDPVAYYVLIVILVFGCVILVNNLYRSRLGRAWMAVREDEVAAAAMGVNTVTIKLLAFSLGASFSGFAGAYYGAKLSLVGPDNFSFTVSVTVLAMVVLGGMGNIPGVIVGALALYYVLFWFLGKLPGWGTEFASSVGLQSINSAHGAWPGLGQLLQNSNFLILGLILVLIMLLRPQGLIPSREREQELVAGVAEQSVFDARTA